MSNKPKVFNKENWHKYITDKYGEKADAGVLQAERAKLEKKYGDRIVLGTLEDMKTDEEKMDKVEYEALSGVLKSEVPEMEKLDNQFKEALKRDRAIKTAFMVIKNNIWVVVGVLMFLALIKYLLS